MLEDANNLQKANCHYVSILCGLQ